MADTPNDTGGGGGLNPLDFALRALNSLFGFHSGSSGTLPRDAAAKYGADYFTKNRAPAVTKPSPSEPYRGPPSPYGGTTADPGHGAAKGKKKRKKTVLERIKDQLAKEAQYFAEHPTELLRLMPPGRGARMRTGTTRVSRPAVLEKFPPRYQRGFVSATGKAPPPGYAPGTPGAREAAKPPREPPKPPRKPPARSAPVGAPGQPSQVQPRELKPSDLVTNLPFTDYDAEGEPKRLKPNDVAKNLPFTDYDAEGAPSVNKPAAVREPAAQRSASPRPGAGSAGPGRSAPAPGRSKTGTARVLAGIAKTLAPDLLRALTLRTPRVQTKRDSAARAPSLQVGRIDPVIPAQLGPLSPATLTQFSAAKTKTKTDMCECEKPKKRKPRAPRTICRAGAYTQTAKGIKYHPNREVPCT